MDMDSIGIIGKGLNLVKAIILQKLGGRGEFQGGKNGKFNFQFQKTPGEFFGRIRYLTQLRNQATEANIAFRSNEHQAMSFLLFLTSLLIKRVSTHAQMRVIIHDSLRKSRISLGRASK